jgi:hypothetical protein
MFKIIKGILVAITPFLKEIISGYEGLSKLNNKSFFYVITVILIFSCFLIYSNIINAKLAILHKNDIKTLEITKEENSKMKEELKLLKEKYEVAMDDSTECIVERDILRLKNNELENLKCVNEENNIIFRLKNVDKNDCELEKIKVEDDMPPLPTISRIDDLNSVNIILTDYIKELRFYIRNVDDFIDNQKYNCK